MPRRLRSLGPETVGLIEDAPVDLLRAILTRQDGEKEPALPLPEVAPGLSDLDAIHAYRQDVLRVLATFRPDELNPAEKRCRRIRGLSSGKGVTSLNTIVQQQLDKEGVQEFARQPDALCRSIWSYLNAFETFEYAESFHYARQFRDNGKFYHAFEVNLEHEGPVFASSIDEDALASFIKRVLELSPEISCTVKALDLPSTAKHPASVMLIVRHRGPLSSVYDHREDGRRSPIYYRPPNEAIMIYTPARRQIEVCADSPLVRQKVATSFAQVALKHDISNKPLTWKRYNLTRFRTSLRLESPSIDGYEIKFARVLEAEVRLGVWARKLLLRVTVHDNIDEVAARYLKNGNVFRRADGFSRIVIAVAYNRIGNATQRTLNITISGSKSCNLQSNNDPEDRGFGFALLQAWGILSAFRQIGPSDLRSMFAALLQLYDRGDEEVNGQTLRDLGLDPDRLISGGLLERRDRQDVILVEDAQIEGEAAVEPSPAKDLVRIVGPFGEDAGEVPASEVQKYAINPDWLQETLLNLLKPLLSKRAMQILDQDLILLGAMAIDGADVPLYFARRLHDLKVLRRLDDALRARSQSSIGVVLTGSGETLSHLGPNVVVPLLSNLAQEEDSCIVSRDGIELAFRSNYSLARGGSSPRVLRTGTQTAMLYVPGKDLLYLVGADQITIFDRLVASLLAGRPDVPVKELMAGLGSRSPQQAFRGNRWQEIVNVYITKSERRGYWRLVI